MRLLILNPPHPAIGSRIPKEHLPPLGLLAVGGPLIDAGHEVKLLDAEFGPMPTHEIVRHVLSYSPEAILIGHSGSTSAHPGVSRITRAIRANTPHTPIVYGGVYPTFHSPEIMASEPQIDFIVRGEGEATAVRLIEAMESGVGLNDVPGIVFRDRGRVVATSPASLIQNLDDYRVGWELVDHARYSYWGNRRAVVVQFSRGCPHRCNYCGQRGFWVRWRHRDPVKFAAELARLHREQGVEVINFADENPTASRAAWKTFLEALIAEKVPLILVGSTRADDIVRDADIVHLYRKAGVMRLLLGLESTDETTLARIRKDSRRATDREAIRLLRRHGIISMAAYVAGFTEETDRDYWRTLRQVISYDPDQVQALYATPHRWTAYFQMAGERKVIQPDLGRWDYKHQVLANRAMPPWRILAWMKLIEAIAQLRPKSLWRLWAHPGALFRASMRWYYRIGRQVWPYELWHWAFRDKRVRNGVPLLRFMRSESVESSGSPVQGSELEQNSVQDAGQKVAEPRGGDPRLEPEKIGGCRVRQFALFGDRNSKRKLACGDVEPWQR